MVLLSTARSCYERLMREHHDQDLPGTEAILAEDSVVQLDNEILILNRRLQELEADAAERAA